MALECAQRNWLLEIHAHQRFSRRNSKEMIPAGMQRRVVSASF
jgi:hypothetical protein